MTKKLTEQEIQNLEEQIPLVAEVSGTHAYLQALASGLGVSIIENNKIVKISSNGKREFMDDVELDVVAEKGSKFKLK